VRVVQVGAPSTEDIQGFVKETFDVEADNRWLRCLSEESGVSQAYLLARARAIRKNSSSARKLEGRAHDVITSSLKLHIPTGGLQSCRRIPLPTISADMAMKTLQMFDDLPPLFQTLTKVLAVATRAVPLKTPNIIVWQVMNDLYGEIDSVHFATVIEEMKDMHLLKTEINQKVDKLSFESPVIARIALNVCTPQQIRIIADALLYRLESMKTCDFLVPMAMADMCHEIGRDIEMKQCWRLAYRHFVQQPDLSSFERAWWNEQLADAITSTGRNPKSVLGNDFHAPVLSEPMLPTSLVRLRAYEAEICFGPLAHTLSTISRNIVQEYGAHARADNDLKYTLGSDGISIRQLYETQMSSLEEFLDSNDFDVSKETLEEELELVKVLTTPSSSAEQVAENARRFLDELVEDYILPRKRRLRSCIACVTSGTPDAISLCSDSALVAAYEKTLVGKCWKDMLEDALMTMAVKNWKPRLTPECASLPVFSLQTICRLRDKFLKQTYGQRMNDEQFRVQKKYVFSDFQAFLISTAVIYNATDGPDKTRSQQCLRRENISLGFVSEEGTESEDDSEPRSTAALA